MNDSVADLRLLHSGVVDEEEIDHLGHMNVRFYLSKALVGTDALAAEHGLDDAHCRRLGAVLRLGEAFTRHYREQLAGAPLEVWGGVLGAEPDGLRLYQELRNPERHELAAAFVHRLRLDQREARRPMPLPEIVAKSALDARVAWPEAGRARTIDLSRRPPDPGLDRLRELGLAMRQVREIGADECDADGIFYSAGYQDLVWGGEPVEGRSFGWPLLTLPSGGLFGWATLESRGLIHELPRAGSRVQSFSAEVELGRKISYRHQWVYDVDRGALLLTSSIVNLAFDVGTRRSIEIPDGVRAVLQPDYQPDLR